MQPRIRAADVRDIGIIFDIRTSGSQNHLSREELTRLGITHESLGDAIIAGPGIWIAEADGFAAAFAMADMEQGSVFAIFVRPAFEGRGLGRLLMEKVEAVLFKQHEVIWLTTDGGMEIRANGFYRRLGWQPAGAMVEGDIRYEKKRPCPPSGERVPPSRPTLA